MNDILTIEDVKILVDAFYLKVQKDDLLGDIFNSRIENRWPEHLDKMYRFWQTVLLSEHTYFGSPFPPHASLPIEKVHFDRWLSLFEKTIKECFEGTKAEEALWRAGKMAEMFQHKIAHYRNTNTKPIL
jgi:hemoglobin